MQVHVHVKNNRWREGRFPNTEEGEQVFSITRERYEAALSRFPSLADELTVSIDWDTDTFAQSMSTAEVLLAWDFPTTKLREVAPKLRWIHIIGAGIEHLCPLDWMPEGLTLTNNKGVHAAKAGEFGLMSVLMLHSNIPAIVTNQHSERFVSLYASPIAGKTAVVIGTGSLGGAAARQIARLGVRVIGVNRHGGTVDGCERVVTVADLDSVLVEADYILAATPDTPETRNLLDRRRLEMLKPSAGIVNIGRQSIMDYDALCDLLDDGRLANAILDVFDPEPIPAGSRLWRTPNLIITPHVSADDGDAYVPMTLDLFFRNMERFIAGQPLLNPVRPALGY